MRAGDRASRRLAAARSGRGADCSVSSRRSQCLGCCFPESQCDREQRRSLGRVPVQPKSLFYTAASIAHARTSRRDEISGKLLARRAWRSHGVQPSLRRRRFRLNVAMSLAIPPARRNHGNAVRAPGGRNSAAAPATVSGEPKRIKPLGPRALGRSAKARTREPGDRPLTSSSSRRRWDGRGSYGRAQKAV